MKALRCERICQSLLHRLDVENRLVAVLCVYFSLDRPPPGAWIAAGAHNERHARQGRIAPETFAAIDHRPWLRAELTASNVPHHAHDAPRRAAILPEENALTDRIFARKDLPRQSFIHHSGIR